MMQRITTYCAFVLLLLVPLCGAAQTAPKPGTSIDYQAEGLYFHSGQPDSIFAASNVVSTIVQEAENISLAPNHHIHMRRGQRSTFVHNLTNTGNIPTTVTITALNESGDDYDFENITVSEVNPQSAKAPSAMAGAAATQRSEGELEVTLQPGEKFAFEVAASVNNSVPAGMLGRMKVQAKTHKDELILNNTDIIEVLQGPVINVRKEAAESDAGQGKVLTYRINGRNEGDQTARTLTITVDGTSMSRVLLRDRVPANTTFLRSEEAEGGLPLYHTVGDPEFTYSTRLPEDLSTVDEFAVAYDSLQPGQSFNVHFAVTINGNASGLIRNIAQVDYRDPVDNEQQSSSAETNMVEEVLPEYDAKLHYYTDDSYNTVSRAVRLGDPLLLQADAAGCNVSSAFRDTTHINLRSGKTGDEESVEAIETGPNTGYFRIAPVVPVEVPDRKSGTQHNAVMETVGNDIITATLPKCGVNQKDVSTGILVSPYGVIFDSETDQPVSNATVRLIDVTGEGNGGNAGGLATVYNEQGTEEIDNEQLTGEDGSFEFPYVKPGTYRIEVVPPAGYHFASLVQPSELSAARALDEAGSYGKSFTIEGDAGAVAFDVPVDPAPEGALFIEKTASASTAEIGDFVTYRLTVVNNAATTVYDVQVEDVLPFGFRYEKGTARIGGQDADDPQGGEGPSLQFGVGDISAGGTMTLSYRVLLGTGAMKGDGINRAVASSIRDMHIESNTAEHRLEVRGGVFTDKGYIIGKVFADCNENDIQDPGEAGVPGVRIYLENGSFVVTDSEGKYTFYGLNPNTHVLKIDNYTLPQGSRLGVLDNRQAGDPSTRFVDLKKGELHRADFSICNCSETVHNEIEERRQAFTQLAGDEVGASMERSFSADDRQAGNNVKRAEAAGTIDGATIPGMKAPGAVDSSGVTLSGSRSAGASLQQTLEGAMPGQSAETGFINLENNDTLQVAKTRVWTKSRAGTTMELTVNGVPVGGKRIGKKATLASANLQAYEYVGITLEPGANTLAVTETDPFGNERGRKEITVFAAGSIADIDLSVPVNDVPADGATPALIRVQLLDRAGMPVGSRRMITLDVSAGEWIVKDEDPATPGTQTYIEDGVAEFKLRSTIKPEDAMVRVSLGVMDAETMVSFLPDLRPLIAAGVIEGTIRLNDGASMMPAHSADGFERELKSLSYSQDNMTADGRAAFFLKGKIKGNMLLTAGYDSEKDEDRLFRDIQPDEFYPVYGESSVKGYDAQSTGRLYVRVDHKKTYALYGDFVTQERLPARNLGEYNRTQTGLKLHFERDWAQLNVFGSQASSLQRIDEFQGKGLSGPYELDHDDILINSEQVELITRDRNQPGVVISRERLTRFRDYAIEPFSGRIIFKSPVPSVDENLNPVYIRVTYEVEDGAEEYWIAGADAQFDLATFWKVGGSFVEDRNPENAYRLKSMNTSWKLGEETLLIGEVAESTTETDGDGRGGRVELHHRGDIVDARVFAGQTDKNFINRSSQLGRARTEVGTRSAVKLTGSTRLEGEFLYTSNDTLEAHTTGGLLNIQQKFGSNVSAEAGFRYSKQEGSPNGAGGAEDITNQNVRGKLTLGVPKVKGASVFGEYEQDVSAPDRKLVAVGGDYHIKGRGKLYARHEFISSALGQYTLNGSDRQHNTVVGLDADYMQNGNVYSEYRVDDAFDGRSAQAAIGLRNRFEIYEGFGINAGFERIFSLYGAPGNEGTAISTSVDYTANPLWKGTARAEGRFGNNGNSYLGTLGYGQKISDNWTFLGKNIFTLQTTNGDVADRIQQRTRVGFAYRQTGQNRFDALGRYELKYEENGQFGGDYNRLVHIFSTHANYHPSADWTHSGRLAAKKVAESSAEFDSRSLTMLMSARSIYDINRKLDIGVNASIMSDAGFDSKDYGVGAEVGYIVQKNLRLAVGFNVFGFEDRDLAASNYTRKGVYMGFSYKFDERLFRGLMPESDRNSELYATCTECITPDVPQEVLRMPEPEIEFAGLQPVVIEAPANFELEERKTLTTLPKDIHFATDKSNIGEASKAMLDLVASFLQNQDIFTLEITGHTDSRASYRYNLGLSERRAQAVQKYLVSKGVNAGLVVFKGLSTSSSTVGYEEDAIDRALNRRVELNLDIPNVNVRFIPQVNDLQVDRTGMAWDYIYDTRINAVPDRIYVDGGALSVASVYMLQRIALALTYYPDATVRFAASNGQEALIAGALEHAGADMDRVKFEMNLAAASGGVVTISYDRADDFAIVDQRDDVRMANDADAGRMLTKLTELLKVREDYLLIQQKDS